LDALLAVLDPEVMFRADQAAVQMGGSAELRGRAAVAQTFKGRARAARLAVVDGAVGLAVVLQGRLRIVLGLTIVDGKIIAIDAIADSEHVRQLNVDILTD
jgi:RNA polymerase sigma-70 factor, ECF subfamily